MGKIKLEAKDLSGTFRDVLADATGRFGRSYYFRDITKTGYATLTRAQEGSIVAGVADEFHDLVTVTGANTSTSAIKVDIRTGTAGTVLDSIVIPAANVIEKSYTVPLPASEKGQSWTAKVNQSGEISDSPVSITMVAIKNT